MKSLKQVSGSKGRPKLRRTLYRGVNVRIITDADWEYIWADYKKGNMEFLNNAYEMPKDVESEDFRKEVETRMFAVGFNAAWIIHGHSWRRKKEPLGFVIARIDGHRMDSHIHYFYFATKRNKLEGTVKFIQEMRQLYTIIAHVRPEDERFFEHLCRYGIGRKVGVIFEWTKDMKEILLYQSRST